jgi:carboxypeptidase PM20D1
VRTALKVLGSVLLVIAVLVAVLVGNALRQGSVQVQAPPRPVTGQGLDGPTLARKLSSLVQLQTVSEGQGRIDPQALEDLRLQLAVDFPKAHEALEQRTLGSTLVFTWRGTDPSLPAGALLAHQDVVPVADPSSWTHPPFAGVIADGFVWGRGSLDDKQSIVAQLAAVEALLAEGFRPRRTLYFAMGHDEEMGGSGARAFASSLAGEQLDFVLDEGGMVSVGVLDGLSAPAALIGVSEKGYVSLELSVTADGGHSSMPPPHTAVGTLAQAIVALEANPLPPHLDGPTGRMFDQRWTSGCAS